MAKRYEFSMDLDDEDDIVRVPLKSVSTQSTSTDWQRSPISNDKAATLSRQLAKYAQRRGISVSRAAMSQSLMKVEEEPIAQIRITGNQTMQRSPRSTSVTARPSTAAGNFSTPQRNDTHHQIGFSNQNSLSPSNFDSPDFGGSSGVQKRQSRSPNKSDPNSTVGSLSTAFSNLNVKTSPESSMTTQARGSNSSLNSQPPAGNVGVTLQQSPAGGGTSPSMTSSPRRNELEEVARKQEEALRLMVLQKQSAVRKSSGESNPDIQIQTTTPFTAGQMRNADANTSLKTPTTKIPRVIRRSAIPTPTSKISGPAHRVGTSAHAQPASSPGSDETF